jgi:acetolactate synthase small subunit
VSEIVARKPSGSAVTKVLFALLWGVVIALTASSVYLFLEVDRLRADLRVMREQVLVEVTKVQDASSLLDSANRRNLDSIRDELLNAQRTAAVAAGQARTEALRHAEELAKQLDAEQKKQQQQFANQLDEVRQATTTAQTKIADVSTEVTSVRSEVASARSELERTISELKSVRGDLGVQSGLIATNAKELTALRAIGDRNYFDFNLVKTKQMQKVGDITMRVTKVDTKKNRYTIELIADDKKVEKKDKNPNEPLQFYVSRARTPYEIVVNELRKDQIIGYLATPRVQSAR